MNAAGQITGHARRHTFTSAWGWASGIFDTFERLQALPAPGSAGRAP
jgi:hypothetical protein